MKHICLTIACVLPLISTFTSAQVTLQPKAGAPLAGLTLTQYEAFTIGALSYQTPLTIATGLGPAFNKGGCMSCHANPLGGWGAIAVTRFGMDEKGEFIDIPELGGSLLQAEAISQACREVLPPEASVTATRITNSSMAFGMIEAISDANISANADPSDDNVDGISGRVHWVLPLEDTAGSPLRAGRFGWKAQVATVLTFSGDASLNEMGLTNRLVPTENAPNGNAVLLSQCDTVADPEDGPDDSGKHFIDRVTDFQRFLGPPPQTPKTGMAGEVVFNAAGCASCHIASWTTSKSKSLEVALRGKTIRPYCDFLLHDMGTLGDGIQQGDATEQEFRTPTLWNLRSRDPMLHNGTAAGGLFADRVALAINAHGPFGEGAASAAAFEALSTGDRAAMIAFLDSLGRAEFDYDGDGVRDLEDFTILRGYAGVATNPNLPSAIGDVDQNGVINAVDATYFVQVIEGFGPMRDCNNNGIADLVDIFSATMPDADGDGQGDNCPAPCVGDFNADGVVDAADLATLLNAWGTAGGDLNADATTDAADIAVLLNGWGSCR
ncbi:MAG: hypothetical protein EXS10_04325 [Phycisphaerales bacterium]|nr:hypothetical protein [Phycisphaerales bacterium]